MAPTPLHASRKRDWLLPDCPSRRIGDLCASVERYSSLISFSHAMSTIPLACTLTDDQLRCEAAVLLPGLQALATSLTWTREGMQMSFGATKANLSAVFHAVERERHCCGFLTFELIVPASAEPVVLRVHGPEGTRDFLEQLGIRATDLSDSP